MSSPLARAARIAFALTLASSSALAATPAFQHTFDNDRFPGNKVPRNFAAELGDVYVFSTDQAVIAPDPTCDSLSTQVLSANVPFGKDDLRVLFVHQHGEDNFPGSPLGEQEVMSLKVGQARTDLFGIKVGFESVGVNGGPGFQVFPVQLGPALPSDSDKTFGRIYVDGKPTSLRYGNVYDSQCSGTRPVNYQVNVALKLYGQDRQFFVEVTSFGPIPQRQNFGPFVLPDAFDNGYGACHVYAPSGTGKVIVDGVECIASSPQAIDPINGGRYVDRDPSHTRTR